MANVSLEIIEGPAAGRQTPLEGSLEIGRDPGAGLVLDDDLVSRRHARVTPLEHGAVIEDLESRNGTFVNGEEIHAPTQLDPGDQLLIGVSVLELRSARQIAERPSAVRPKPPALASPARTPNYVPKGVAGGVKVPELDALLDIHTKGKAKTAPLAIFVLVVIVVLIYLATR